MLTLLLASLAVAGEADYRACCAEQGVDCPATLGVVGQGTHRDYAGLTGLWLLTCSQGASFFAHARSADARLQVGDVADAPDPRAVACLVRACELPEDVCLDADVDDTLRAVRCGTDTPADARALGSPPAAPIRAVTIAVVRPAPAPAPVATTVEGTPALHADAVLEVRRPEPTPAATVAVSPVPVKVDPALWSLPAPPPAPCVVSSNLRDASNDQVSLGDEARVTGDVVLALGHYRAALQVNACNGFAWTALGSTFAEHGYTSRGAEALRTAVRLAPRHLPAWVALAAADEALGRPDDAIEAWQQAVALRPGYPAAEDGLRRLGRGP